MKSFIYTILALIALLIPLKTHAVLYPLTATKTTSGITVTMTGAPAGQSKYDLYDGGTVISRNLPSTDPWTQQATNGVVTWELASNSLTSNKTYNFQVKRLPNLLNPNELVATIVTDRVTIVNGTTPATAISVVKDFAIAPTGTGKVTVSGKIDTSIYSNPNAVRIDFYYSKTGTLAEGPTNAGVLTAGIGGQAAIGPDGTYAIVVSNLEPGAKYFFKQTISTQGSTSPFETKIETFTADKGYLIPGSVGEQLDFNSRSYHLLAPLPGLSVLMDPDLCAEKKAKGEVPMDSICDVNGFLDYAFKLLIGAAAVILVLRLMYEGYVILTSDVPFIQAKSKEGFKTALLGLLLALSSYIILNTINPKLVNNTISIDSVSVGVDDENELDPGDTIGQDTGGIPSGKVAACKGTIVSVATSGGTFYACSDISTQLKAMIDKAWSEGIKISGGGFRTHAQQIGLRRNHCGSSNFDIYQKASSACRPPTARPGKSNHESGLAFDLTCNGRTIKARDNACFIWLQTNAKNYGLKNFAKEPWHWSVNGK